MRTIPYAIRAMGDANAASSSRTRTIGVRLTEEGVPKAIKPRLRNARLKLDAATVVQQAAIKAGERSSVPGPARPQAAASEPESSHSLRRP